MICILRSKGGVSMKGTGVKCCGTYFIYAGSMGVTLISGFCLHVWMLVEIDVKNASQYLL